MGDDDDKEQQGSKKDKISPSKRRELFALKDNQVSGEQELE